MSKLHLNRQEAEAKHRGAWAEMVACCWLLQQGYEMFRNVSHHGCIDIVAIKCDQVYRFDVKSYKSGDTLACRTPEQIKLGVQFLVIRDDGTVEISNGNPPLASSIVCRQCEKPFKPNHKSQKICSVICRNGAQRKAQEKFRKIKKEMQP